MTTAQAPDVVHFQRQIDESRDRRIANDMNELTRLVSNYNHTQGMACTGMRLDPYTPCNGSAGQLCMQCPRRKGLNLTQAILP